MFIAKINKDCHKVITYFIFFNQSLHLRIVKPNSLPNQNVNMQHVSLIFMNIILKAYMSPFQKKTLNCENKLKNIWAIISQIKEI